MADIQLSPEEQAQISELVAHYQKNISIFEALIDNLRRNLQEKPINVLIHSIRSRVKDPDHLREKLERKYRAAKEAGLAFEITVENLFERINDLAGIRLLHLHTTEFPEINTALLALLEEHRYRLIEGPEARVWDDELRQYFQSIGVPIKESRKEAQRMYTSVHYVVEANRKTKATAEIQVRTLAEELWGEVDHKINYPKESAKLACREQIKVLARVTGSCTRLVDAIFRTHNEGA